MRLKSLEGILGVLPRGVIESGVVFIELDSMNYESLKVDIDSTIQFGSPILYEGKVEDIGRCLHLSYMGYRVLVTCNKQVKDRLEDYYVAFKTKIDDGVLDQPSTKAEDGTQ